MTITLTDVLNELEKQDQKTKKRSEKVVKPVTLESELERLAGLKWKDDIVIFNEVRDALQSGELTRTAIGKMKKDDIYEFHKELTHRRREARKQQVRDSKPDNYWIIQDGKTWLKFQRLMFDENLAGWDTETTGLNLFAERIVAVCIYLPKANVSAYVPFAHRTGEKQLTEEEVLGPCKEWLEDPENGSVWHNYNFDGHMFYNHGIEVANPAWDTMVVGRILNEHEKNHKLKPLYDKYCGQTGEVSDMFDDLIDNHDIAGTDIALAGVYGCGDPYKTFKLYQFQKPYIDTVDNLHKVWYEVERPLLNVDLRVERQGFLVDTDGLNQIEQEQLPKIAQAEQELKDAFQIDGAFLQRMAEKLGKPVDEFNFNSNDHLPYLLYDHLGVGEDMPKKFGKGPRSTAKEVIEAILNDVPQLRPLKEYRELFKLVSTYARKIPNAMEIDGRLHSKFNSFGTATGRYASSEYGNDGNKKGTNLQNIPSRTALGKKIRQCIIPDPAYLFVSSDLSQIEPRQIANLLYLWCGDNSMRQLYLDGVDLYTTMAMKVFGLEYEQCVDGAKIYTDESHEHYWEPRKVMKTGVLAALYGQSPKSFAKKMGVSDEVAQQFFKGMDEQFPGIKPFREKILNQLLRKEYSETLFGRKRRFPGYAKMYGRLQQLNRKPRGTLSDVEQEERNELWRKTAKMQREAINAVIQGTSADILKSIMIRLDKICREHGWRLMMSIHDEIMLMIPKEQVTPEAIGIINEAMTKTVTCTVPLKCDTVIQPRWQEEYKPGEWNFDLQCPKEAA